MYFLPVAGQAKAAQLAGKAPYIAGLIKSAGRIKSAVKGLAIGSAMWTGGKIAQKLPDVSFSLGKRTDISDITLSQRAKRIIGQTGERLRRTPLPEQRRIRKLLDDTRGKQLFAKLTRPENLDSGRYKRALEYLRRTGADGKRLLSALQPEPRRYLLDLQNKAAFQRHLTRAYAQNDDISAADVGDAVKTYESLDSEGKAEFSEILTRNGDEAVDFASRSDSATFEAIVSPCRSGSVPSLGGAGSLRTDRYHSIEALPSPFAQSGGSCPDLPDDIETDLQDALVDVDADLDADQVIDVRRSIEELDGDARDSAINLIEREGADGVSVTNDATDLVDELEGLDSDDVDDLMVSYDNYANADDVGRSPREIQNNLDQLARNDVDGLAEAIKERTGGPNTNNFNGLDGEIDAATNLVDRNDVTIDRLEKDIGNDRGSTDIDILLEDGTAIEVKNRDYNEVPSYAENREIRELTEKMSKYAEEKDSITIATRGNPENADVLQAVKANIESDYSDTTVALRNINNPSR